MNVAEGYASIEIDGVEYFLTPSFGNIAKLGTPEEIVFKFRTLMLRRASGVSAWIVALEILEACGLPSEIIGGLHYSESKKRSLIKPGVIPPEHCFILAEHCMQHGMCGSDDQLDESDKAGDSSPVTEFDPYTYIVMAMDVLSISMEQAENLTMTKFIKLVNAKLQLRRKKEKPDVKDLSKAEVSDIMRKHREAKAKRAAEQAAARG